MSREYRTTHCRFCKEWSVNGKGMVKYGVRHYAHFDCYLTAGKSLDDLPSYPRSCFPEAVIKAHQEKQA